MESECGALALDNRSRQDAQREKVAAEMGELRRLIREQSENVGQLTLVVERTEEHVRMHPSMLYLLRFRTKETVAVIVLLFVLLSLWYVSGFRRPILRWLGLPLF